MKCFQTAIMIQSAPETIWAILVNIAQWAEWNPTIARVEGQIAPGATVTVYTKNNPKQAFPLQVSEFVPLAQMTWTGGMPLGLFRGDRTYQLTPQPDGSVEFSMQECFTGLLAPLITRSIPDLQPAFDEFAVALKQRAESVS